MSADELTCQASDRRPIREWIQSAKDTLREKLQRALFRASMALVEDGYAIRHARIELEAMGYDLDDSEEGPNKWMVENVFDLLRVFSAQGHSGASAPYAVETFRKLALHEPLCPLNGELLEWVEVGPGVFQNKRCSHVFKQADRFNGQAYDLDGRVFREPNGACYTNADSRVPIVFPYTPTRIYVDVPEYAHD